MQPCSATSETAPTRSRPPAACASSAPSRTLYRANDPCDAFFVVARGELTISAKRRGEDVESVLRRAHTGDAFGEEAFASPRRRATAAAASSAPALAEIPVHIFRRAAVRSGKAELAERLERAMQRAATRDVLRTTVLGAELDKETFDMVLDAATTRTVARGESIYRAGESAEAMFIVAEGRVQIQVEDDARLRVRGYLGPGDFFGDEEILFDAAAAGRGGGARAAGAVASGATSLVEIPAAVVRAVAAREPRLFARYRRIAADEQRAQDAAIAGAARNATQHLFRDLYRLEIARSLLVIDLESCVRCGHCTWSCGALHGTPRLVRRGDKIVTPKASSSSIVENAHLMVPSSCQHCENPACMVDCPTGAISKDASGEVFIREALCTGCGACARACPWDNIQMAERPATAPRPEGSPSPEVAVKCDLCSAYATGPACVEACPTEALHRIEPSSDLVELRAWLGRGTSRNDEPRARRSPAHAAWVLGALGAAVAVAAVGVRMQAARLFVPSGGIGFAAGVASAIGMIGLLAYGLPKRAIRAWKRRRRGSDPAATPKRDASILKPWLTAHVALGWMTLALALAHAPVSLEKGTAPQLLVFALIATTVLGAWMALAYRLVPARLAKIERTAVLPEDFAAEKRALVDRLYRSVSGRSDVVKKLAEKILLPYARSRLGPLVLLLSGRDLRAEQRALAARVERVLEGRGKDRLAGIEDLVRVVVEIRSLPAQRLLVALLRVGLPLHVVTFTAALVLGVAHVGFGVGR
ncbi:MAG: cyclic nucleotide-binding domain-containing protein [Polyangiaceae bacterium]